MGVDYALTIAVDELRASVESGNGIESIGAAGS